MLQAMYNGVSGLAAQQTWMDAIGNNIANVNTTGYKSTNVTFEDQLSETIKGASGPNSNTGGTNPIQVGLGVQVGAISTDTAQGGLASTSKPTDMAISGNGYFMLGTGSAISYTRDGSFTLDSQGNLVNSATGSYVLGWSASPTGVVDPTQQIQGSSKLQIPIGSGTATNPTANVSYSGNLSADVTPGAATTYTRSVKVYDSLGEPQTATLTFRNAAVPAAAPTAAAVSTAGANFTSGTYFVKYAYTYPGGATGQASAATAVTVTTPASNSINITTPGPLPPGATGIAVYTSPTAGGPFTLATPTLASNTGVITTKPVAGAAQPPAAAAGTWVYSASGGTAPAAVTGSGSITFDSNGNEVASTGSITLANTDGSGTPQTINPNFTDLTQVAGASSAAPVSQDGSAPGVLQSFAVDNTGTITGAFSNGVTKTLGQIALANFTNPGGLVREGANQFGSTTNSGAAQVGTVGQSGLGSINAGFLEQSNVDISNEFTHMIVSQRGFEANTKIITTVDQLLSDVIGLIR